MHSWDDDRIYQRACIGLIKEGLEVHLIASNPGTKHFETSGVEFHWLKQRHGWKRRILSSAEAYRKALEINADIFHFHDPDLLPWMLLLSFRGKKVIYDVHENYSERIHALAIPSCVKQILAKLWSHFERFCGAKYSGIITTTLSMQSLFEGIQIPKISISNAPYLSVLGEVNLKVDKRLFTIYTSGTNSYKRNCMQTIEALPFILKRIPAARLIFVGRYSPIDFKFKLEARAIELGVETHVELEGLLPWKENFIRTAQMEIGCVFYEDNINNRLTVPNRLFEYMYSGVAVIGEDFLEIQKVIQESQCGIVVNSSDPESIADGVISLFSDIPALRKMQSNAKRKVITTYAYEYELKKMIAYYNSII